jgi:hypothetical protein
MYFRVVIKLCRTILSVLERWQEGFCLVNLLTGQVHLQNKEVVQETPHASISATAVVPNLFFTYVPFGSLFP